MKTESGYRLYEDAAVRRLTFIKHAQRCGFTLAEIRELLGMHEDDGEAHAGAVALARRKIAEMAKLREDLLQMESALTELLDEPPANKEQSPASRIVVALDTATTGAAD